MKIKFVEIQNFRKLKSVRIDFSDETTILVGANNSGKTSATVALNYFLVDSSKLKASDFTISNWKQINKIGETLEKALSDEKTESPKLLDWIPALPTLDLWLDVGKSEIHRVMMILPSLSWDGGLLGVRFRFEPKDLEKFYGEFFEAKNAASKTLKDADSKDKFSLWPKNLYDYLDRRLNAHFGIKSYVLDAKEINDPDVNGIASIQTLKDEAIPLDGNVLEGIIKINKISAHRGLVDASDEKQDGEVASQQKSKLSSQFRRYYDQILDPAELPDSSDILALKAIATAQKSFDKRLQEGFEPPFKELRKLGYPGITDPDITISTKINPMEGLNHPSAISFGLTTDESIPTLPESYNGLGYQNLVFMVFEILRFRDEFMRIGKLGKKSNSKNERKEQPAIHLLIIEEPEAHLHVQVQQVFIRKAYEVLTNHPDLKPVVLKTSKSTKRETSDEKDGDILPAKISSQIVLSTHSSRIAHEVDFAQLRYFRRLPSTATRAIPVSTVINLREVFGKENATAKFVTRYLRSVHCELFFADGIIIVEGAAEQILLPHFLAKDKFRELNESYISILEIGGSHAHRLRGLIEELGIPTLLITDLDAKTASGKKVVPAKSQDQKTRNYTVANWVPGVGSLDELVGLAPEELVKDYVEQYFSIRAAFQQEVSLKFPVGEKAKKVIPSTFEDALIFENHEMFKEIWNESQDEEIGRELHGKIGSICNIVGESTSLPELQKRLFDEIEKKGFKAEFALDVLFEVDPVDLNVPSYIDGGLSWLQEQVVKKREEIARNK